MKHKIKNIIHAIISISIKSIGFILGLILSISRKLQKFFYNTVDLENYSKFVFLLKKYIRKLLIPSILISFLLDAIYISVWNYAFHSVQPIVFFFLFILVFVVLTVKGCLHGENINDRFKEDN